MKKLKTFFIILLFPVFSVFAMILPTFISAQEFCTTSLEIERVKGDGYLQASFAILSGLTPTREYTAILKLHDGNNIRINFTLTNQGDNYRIRIPDIPESYLNTPYTLYIADSICDTEADCVSSAFCQSYDSFTTPELDFSPCVNECLSNHGVIFNPTEAQLEICTNICSNQNAGASDTEPRDTDDETAQEGAFGNPGKSNLRDLPLSRDNINFDRVNPLKILDSPQAEQFSTPGGIISRVLVFLFPIVGLILFIMIFWGGFEILSQSATKKSMDAGRQRITAAIIGFFILFSSYWIIQILEIVFNLTIL